MKTFKSIKYKLLGLLLISISIYSGCKKDDYVETIGLCPTIIATNPDNLETLVALDQTIEITFNEKMDISTFTSNSFTLEAIISGAVAYIPGSLTYDESRNVLIFNPNSLFDVNTTYTGRVKPIVKDLSGNLLQQEFIWTFSTSATISPSVIYTDPDNLDSLVDYDKVITATFNMPMDPTTITNTSFRVYDGSVEISGIISYGGLIAGFVPSNLLEPSTVYTCIISTSAKNLDGTSLLLDYTWTFKTRPISIPSVLNVDPFEGENSVVINKTIKATFSEKMDPTSFDNVSFVLTEGINTIDGIITVKGAIFTFNPTNNLNPNLTYTAKFSENIKSLLGIPLASVYPWQFTTGNGIAPEILSVNPIDGSSNVPFNQVISATFDQVMDPSTFTNTSFRVSDGLNNIAGQITYNGSTASFTPTDVLIANTTYTATITNTVKNVGGISIANNYEWEFSTNSVGINLNSVARFGIIAGVGVTNAAGFSVINNLDVGIYPGVRSSIVGFPPAVIINGKIYAADDPFPAGIAAMLIQAKQDLVDAYLVAKNASMPAPQTVAGDQGGKTLAPGIYKSTSTLLIQSGDLTLDAQGDANAVWIFQIESDFTTVGGAGGNIILAGGAQAKNIYWQTGSSATLGNSTIFKGNILALTSITMNSGAVAEGRMLAQNGSVVMTSTNTITKP
jgi:hypothetical protein